MRKYISFLIVLLIPAFAQAGEPSLIYESSAAVKAAKFKVGTAVADGVVVSMDLLSPSAKQFLVGEANGYLRAASLSRTDNDLNVALLRWGNDVSDASLQAAHKANGASLIGFLPRTSVFSSPTDPGNVSTEPTLAPVYTSAGPFRIRINGVDAGGAPVELKNVLRKSAFTVEVVNVSSMTFWNVEIEITSNPKLSFWKPGKKMGLNDVPQPRFTYAYQLMFKPMAKDASFKVPAEAHYIDESDYEWTIRVKTKSAAMEEKFKIHFK